MKAEIEPVQSRFNITKKTIYRDLRLVQQPGKTGIVPAGILELITKDIVQNVRELTPVIPLTTEVSHIGCGTK